MPLTKEATLALCKQFGNDPDGKNTGASATQVALFTHKISYLTDHLKTHKKDHAARLGLIKLVGKRKSLLAYEKNKNIDLYRSLLKTLNIRK